MADMPSGTFRLRGRVLKEIAKEKGIVDSKGNANRHQVSLRAGVSYPTVDKYFENYDEVESIHLRSLAGILVDAFGMTPDEVLNLKLGDLFEFVSENERMPV